MPYIIPSSAVTPGTVYQPGRGVPAYITANARAMACIKGGALSATHMLDQSPRNNGTRRTGEEGRCVDLNGTNQAVRVADNTALDITDNLTVCVWAKNDNPTITGLETIFSKYDYGNNNREWTVYVDNNLKAVVGFGDPNDGTFESSFTSINPITVDSFNHFCFTFETGVLKVFINGTEVGGSITGVIPASLFNGTCDLCLGCHNQNNSAAFEWDGQIFDARIYAGDSTVLTAAQIQSIYEDGPNNIQFTGQSLRAHYKLDEQSGTTCYDSSGNGNNGTIENAVSNWGVTHDILSFQNQVGFNTSGAVYIPRDESDPTNDVLGNPLTNTGRRPNDAALHSSNCLTADGTLYIAAAHLAGTETVVSSGGTSTPSISAGRIDFTAGTCWDLTLSDGTHYPLSEGGGIGIHDDSVSGNHGVLTNAVLANAWGGSQSSYNKNLFDGFVYAYQTAKQVFTGGQTANITGISFKFRSTDNVLCVFNNGSSLSNPYLLLIVDGSSSNIHVTAGNGTPVISIDGSTSWGTTRDQLHTALCDGEVHEVSVTGLSFVGDFVTDGIYVNSFTYSSTYLWDLTTYIWDLEATDSNGDPIYPDGPDVRLPAVTLSVGPYSIPLTDLPSNGYRNRAETLIDLDPDSTPEMGATQLGITVPASHAFGDAFAASDQIFSRQRSKTEDRFLVFPQAQTGSALTNIQKYTQP